MLSHAEHEKSLGPGQKPKKRFSHSEAQFTRMILDTPNKDFF